MIVKIGNIFESNAKTLVNTVNCVGVMGKGIALEFKNKYPEMYKEYVDLCKFDMVKPGIPYYYSDILGTSIINFPTKDHWKSPSKLSYITSGLKWFRDNYKDLNIESIAFPPLGCGNGGLPWSVVGPLMYSMLYDLPINIEIFAPYGTPPEQIKEKFLTENLIHSTKEVLGVNGIKFNKYWLMILYVVQKLNSNRYSLNVGRTIFQKVCYILTRVGIPTGFNFVAGSYGPYSPEVSSAITALSNANWMTEKSLGNMVETVVSSSFVFPYNDFSEKEMRLADVTVDLLSRIQSTEQAELIATVLFSYDELRKKLPKDQLVSEAKVFDFVMKWKPRWKGIKEEAVFETIHSLSMIGWIRILKDTDANPFDEDLF